MKFNLADPRLRRVAGTLQGCALTTFLAVSGGLPSPAAAPEAGYRSDRVLVSFKRQAPMAARTAALARHGLTLIGGGDHFAVLQMAGSAQTKAAAGSDAVKAMIQRLRADSTVRIAEPDFRVQASAIPNDSRFSEQWNLHNTGQTGGAIDADVDAPEAWDQSTGSSQVTVAVVDSGCDLTHPDLAANLLRDGAGNVVGYDFVNRDTDPSDDFGHGTHVSGTIGAVGNNRLGVTGVCQSLRIMPIKFLDAGGGGDLSDAILALDFARTHGARVINNSWGGGGFSQLLFEAILRCREAGVLVVAAAGNDRTDNDVIPTYPANYNQDTDNVLSVAATDNRDQVPSFSNVGASTVDIAAPGDAVLSTLPGGAYGLESGTSMSTPHVSGALALLWARNPTLLASEVKSRVLSSADRVAGVLGKVASGRLNVGAALENDTTPPTAPASFRATHVGATAISVTWVSTGDDGVLGSASVVDLRISSSAITAASFTSATAISHTDAPAPSGQLDSALVAGLAPGTRYYLGLKLVDNVGNRSTLSSLGPIETLTGSTILSDGAEDTPLFVGEGGWSVSTEAAFGGAACYADSPGGAYPPSASLSLTTRSSLLLAGGGHTLAFYSQTDLENGFDYLLVEVQPAESSSWDEVGRLTGFNSTWSLNQISLSAYSGRTVRIRFRIFSDSSVQGDGVRLDNILVTAAASRRTLLSDSVETSQRFASSGSWAASSERSYSPTRAYTDSPGAFYAASTDQSLYQIGNSTLNLAAPEMSFRVRTDLEPGFDYLRTEISTDAGVNWRQVDQLTGAREWLLRTVSLAEFSGKTIQIRFRLTSDRSQQQDGVWIDDVTVGGEALQPLPTGDPAPEAPSGVAVTTPAFPPGATQLKVVWRDNSTGETGFRVERSGAGMGFEPIVTLGPNSTQWQDSGLLPLTTYTYRVVAEGLVTPSIPSAEGLGTTLSTIAPSALSIQPSSLILPRTRLRRTGKATFRLTNTGATHLTVTVGPAPAPFKLVGVTAKGFKLLAGKSRAITVQFRPVAVGVRLGTITVSTSEPGVSVREVSLSGEGNP